MKHMNVLVFGNIDDQIDARALQLVDQLQPLYPEITFKTMQPNQDIPSDQSVLYLMDVVSNISIPTLFTEKHINAISLPPRATAHDYDLGFQLKYLLKLGKLKRIRLIGIPQAGKISHDQIHSIFKKLVAQDIQGS